MLSQEMISKMYAYNYWANHRILTAAEPLSADQLEAPSSYSHGSLRRTFYHMLSVECIWRSLCQNHRLEHTWVPRREELGTIAQFKERWLVEENLMGAYLASLTETGLAEIVQIQRRDGSTSPMTIWHMLVHAANHSMQHRSEAAAGLTGFNRSPGDLDFIFFV